MKHYPFPNIELIKNILIELKHKTRCIGYTEDISKEPIYDNTIPLPKLKFKGTVKIHGTNASIVRLKDGTIYAQSREKVIVAADKELGIAADDNFGFALWVKENQETLKQLFEETDVSVQIIYGEWAGPGINNKSNVAILNLPNKMFFPFEMHVSDSFDDMVRFNPDDTIIENLVYPIDTFGTYEIEIDFENPSQSVEDQLNKLTTDVEQSCPVAKYFGIEGMGEGIVWTYVNDSDVIRFKTKGQKHSVNKGKTESFSQEKLNSIQEFVDYAVTPNRVQQAISTLFPNSVPTKKDTGKIIQWVADDVIKEESNTLDSNELTLKEVAMAMNNKTRELYFLVIDSIVNEL